MKFILIIVLISFAYGDQDQDQNQDQDLGDPIAYLLERLNASDQTKEDVDRVTEALVSHLIGPPIILSTPNTEILKSQRFPGFVIPPQHGGPQGKRSDANNIYLKWRDQMQNAMNVLKEHKVRGNQYEAIDLLHKILDMAKNFHDLIENNVLELNNNQEIEITNSAKTPIRLGVRGIHESTFQGTLNAGGSAFVLKEFMGLKSILVCRAIPIWQEPWYSRRRIIGYKRIYYLKLIPCEYLKSILYKDTPNGIIKSIKTTQHCDRALMSFWNYPLLTK